ncbi:MAG: beta-propeller domain-containing protein [Candidatus Thermoplasmatota archaeon]|nr:beta-propeller domain-containing protein [Candidatus Thermoplasmatota archaeon]
MDKMQIKIIGVVLAVALIGTAVYYSLTYQNETILNIQYPTYQLMNFGSYDDLNTFLENSGESGSNSGVSLGGRDITVPSLSEMDGGDSFAAMDAEQSKSYSGTNIQELGVDEPDIVKTDGTYLYVISESKLYIILAYPAEDAEIIATISFNDSETPQNLFIYGERLAVITQSYLYYNYPLKEIHEGEDGGSEPGSPDDNATVSRAYDMIWTDTTTTHLYIFDVSVRSSPVQTQDIQMKGYFSNARMIDSFIYVITTYYDYNMYEPTGNDIYIPQYSVNGLVKDIGLSSIYYIDFPGTSKTQTNIISVDILDDTLDVTAEVFLLGDTSTVYVSTDHIYITSYSYNYDYTTYQELMDTYVLPYLPSQATSDLESIDSLSLEEYQKTTVVEWIIQNYVDSLDEDQKQTIARQLVAQYEKTIIHKISIDNGDITYMSQGTVPGTLLNQFSLSEYDGYLRVATTIHGWMMRPYLSNSIDSYNNVYVLDDALEIVGTLENIAPDEQIYSVRFLDSICYLVTFKQIDPFFVIDLSDPLNPVILGELKIPGYSTYLHPVDDTHVIGIGMQESQVKVSLFSVIDVFNPEELATYMVERQTDSYSWSSSTALYEHKAFLYDEEKQLLIIPISTNYKESAYVFDVSMQEIMLKGIITHESDEIEDDEDPEYYGRYWYRDYSYSIKRSLYIEDVIYTVSDAMIQMNMMDDLSYINSIVLS